VGGGTADNLNLRTKQERIDAGHEEVRCLRWYLMMRFVELLGLFLLVFLVGVASLSPLGDAVAGCLHALLAVLSRAATTT